MRKFIFQGLWLLFSAPVSAQYTFNNTGNLQIHTGAAVTAFGSFTNTSTATLVNNSHFYIKGNITNDQSAMSAGAGTLYLNGSTAQAINGSESFKTLQLVTNNAAGITLNNNLSVAGVHTFTTGIITTSATPDYLIYEAGASYTGDGDNNHVNGWVKKLGSTNFAFPVGNGTYERKVSVVNLSTSLEFDCHYRATTPDKFSVLSPLITVDPYEYWEVNLQSSGTAQVTMNWDNSKVPFPDYILTDVRTARYNGSMWADLGGSATGNVYTLGSITSGITSAFGLFTFGSHAWSLPLKFIDITAERKQHNTLVQWVTAQEYNVDHFEVERSNNAAVFNIIGRVNAINNGSGHRYDFTDVLPLDGTAYYRIRSIDRDGKVNYSGIAAVTDNNTLTASISVLQNPVHNNIFLAAAGHYRGTYGFTLFNASGQLLQSGQLQIAAGVAVIPLAFNVQPGSYTLVLKNNMHQVTKKIVVR